MKTNTVICTLFILLPFISYASIKKTKSSDVLQPVSFNEVILEDNFWLPRLQIQKEVLVPFALEKIRPAMDNLRKTGNYLNGVKDELPFPHRFVASDLYKVMEELHIC